MKIANWTHLLSNHSTTIILLVSLIFFQDSTVEGRDSEIVGLWINQNTETPGITKCKIRYQDDRFIVRIWGNCSPVDCDWGENSSDEISKRTNIIHVTWDNKNVERKQTLELIEGQLHIATESAYMDGRAPSSFSEIFVKD